MTLQDKIKSIIKHRIEDCKTFDYWLENGFIDFILGQKGNYFSEDSIIKVSVTLNRTQLSNWNMTEIEVKDYLKKEGFSIIDNELVTEDYKGLVFYVSFDGMDEFLKSVFY